MIRFTRVSIVLGAVVLLVSACGDGGTPLSPAGAAVRNAGGTPALGGNAAASSEDSYGTESTAESDSTSRGGQPVVGGN